MPGWPVIVNLCADPHEKTPEESGLYIRWYADNIWLFVPVQQKLKEFLFTIPNFPFQQGSSLNAAGINDDSIQQMQAMKRLKSSRLFQTRAIERFATRSTVRMKNNWKRVFEHEP